MDVTSWIDSGFGVLIGIVSGVFISAIAMVMIFSGRIFEALIDFTILSFSDNFSALVENGVNVSWVLFRDITNIILIGMFVYLAFNVMLNITSINVEKLIVRVLVMAVLINFSLFTTKVIIDVSNITAMKFYEQMQTDQGLAVFIIEKAGIVSGLNTDDLLSSFSVLTDVISVGWSEGTAPVIVYSLIISSLLAGLIGIFIYGSILLISRVLTLVFLMITSPLAFASWMIPGLEHNWSKWWSTLLKNAFFAPFLMLFLWASTKIIEGVNADASSVVKLISDQNALTSDLMIKGLFFTVIVLGLFYASIKLANSFSVIGTSFAESLGMRAFGVTMKWSGAGVIGQMGAGLGSAIARASIGHGAGALQKVNLRLARVPVLGNLASARLDSALEKIKKSGMRLGDSEKARKFASQAGISLTPTLSREQKVGFDKTIIEKKREVQAKKETSEAKQTLKQPNRSAEDAEKYKKMQQEHLQMYANVAEKEIGKASRKMAEAGRVMQALDTSIAQAKSSGNYDKATKLMKEKQQQEQIINQATDKISSLRDKINKIEEAKLSAARGEEVDLSNVYTEVSKSLAEGSAAKKELDAIHKMKDEIREQLMIKQYFNPDLYHQKPPSKLAKKIPFIKARPKPFDETSLIARAFDPTAKEIKKEAVKSAQYPDHYKKLGGQFKDEAVATKEVVNRAIKELAREGTKYVDPPK